MITPLGPPGDATIALALSTAAVFVFFLKKKNNLTKYCFQVERALSFWHDGHITLESTAGDKKGKNWIRKAINEYTGKGTKSTDFNHANWQVATNGYLASIRANLANGKLIWKEVISAAMEFVKSNGNEDPQAAGGDMEDERALLVADSDSNSDSDL